MPGLAPLTIDRIDDTPVLFDAGAARAGDVEDALGTLSGDALVLYRGPAKLYDVIARDRAGHFAGFVPTGAHVLEDALRAARPPTGQTP